MVSYCYVVNTTRTCGVKGEEWTHSVQVPSQVDASPLRVHDDEGENAVQHGERPLGSETLVEVNDDLRVAVGFEVQSAGVAKIEGVVNLSVTHQRDVWMGSESHGLHAVFEIVDLQTVKAEQRVRDVFDGFDSRRVGAAFRDSETVRGTVVKDVFILDAKECPDAAHSLISHLD